MAGKAIMWWLGIPWLFFYSLVGLADNSNLPLTIASFSRKEIKIGEIVRYRISCHHSKDLELIFPGNKFDFSPFELVSKEFYPTRTIDSISIDSAVYLLRTFELKDSILFQIPLFVVQETGDSTILKPAISRMFVSQLTKGMPTESKLLETIQFRPLQENVNYTYYFFLAAVILVAFFLLFFLFRKGIVKRYKLYAIRQNHSAFTKNFTRLEKDFLMTQRLPLMEHALSLWKIYLSRLENTPINTYTTTEIMELFKHDELALGLQIMDKSIYRGMISGEAEKAFGILREFSQQRYQKIKREIIHG